MKRLAKLAALLIGAILTAIAILVYTVYSAKQQQKSVLKRIGELPTAEQREKALVDEAQRIYDANKAAQPWITPEEIKRRLRLEMEGSA